jgi:hypothetical protein
MIHSKGSRNTSYADSCFGLGELKFLRGDLGAAEQMFIDAKKSAPKWVKPYLAIAGLYDHRAGLEPLRRSEWKSKAERTYLEAMDKASVQSVEFYLAFAEFYERSKETSKTEAILLSGLGRYSEEPSLVLALENARKRNRSIP